MSKVTVDGVELEVPQGATVRHGGKRVASLAKLASIPLALLLVAGEAAAQRTGSRLGRTAQVGNVDDAELAMAIMARCVVARRPHLVRQWFALLPGTPEESQLLRSQTEDLSLCLESDRLVLDGHSIRFQSRAFRRPVALAFVERRLSEAPREAPLQAAAEPWFMARIARLAPAAPLDRGSLVVQDFGHCVALRAWQDTRALFATATDSAEEAAAVRRLMPVLGPCLSEGVTINITRRNLRLMLAEPFYHLMIVAREGATAANR